jgi:hypothetical protein
MTDRWLDQKGRGEQGLLNDVYVVQLIIDVDFGSQCFVASPLVKHGHWISDAIGRVNNPPDTSTLLPLKKYRQGL